MRNDRIGEARKVARGINKAELRGAAALEDSVQLMSQIIQARRALNLPPSYSADAVARAAAATNLMAQAMEQLAQCHKVLAEHRSELGLDCIAFGDECQWTLDGAKPAIEGPPLRIVA